MNPYESARETELRELREKYRELEYENDDLKKELKRLEEIERMNKHLLEIHKNRSNALREIRPKKEHSGYVPKYQEMVYDRNKGDAWKTVVETPYSTDLTYSEVKTPVEEYVKQITGDERGIKTKISFRRNYITGLWNCNIIMREYKNLDFEVKE